MKSVAKLDKAGREGHGDDGPSVGVTKGSYVQVGTVAPLSHSPISVNKKTGHNGTGDQ